MTNEELSALPERKDFIDEIQPDGTTVRYRVAAKFCRRAVKPDDVILFHDKDGSWFVDYHLEGGPYKRRACL